MSHLQVLFAAGLMIVPLLYLGYARATLKMPTDGVYRCTLASAVLGVEGNVRESFLRFRHIQSGRLRPHRLLS